MDFVKMSFHLFKKKLKIKELLSPVLGLDLYGYCVPTKGGSVLWSFWCP
jgi:hypothetical protein